VGAGLSQRLSPPHYGGAMEAVLLLADAAVTDPGNKVHALGLGWTVTSTPTPPAALIALVKVPWTATNQPHRAVLRMLDADGRPVLLPGPDGDASIEIVSDFEVGRPPGLPIGTDIDVPLVVTLGLGMPLAPDARYVWQLEIDGEVKDGWSVPFSVRPGSAA